MKPLTILAALVICLRAVAFAAAPGDFDLTFGGTGKVVAEAGGGTDHVEGTAIQNDGKVIVAGYTSGSATQSNICLVRYNTDGSRDLTFNGTGKVITQLDFQFSKAYAVRLQSDGKIVIAGETQIATASTPQFALVRYNTDGSIDHAFGANGLALSGTLGGARSLLIQSDGKLVAAGNGTVARYLTDGTADTSFGTNGLVSQTTTVGDAATLQSDGKIVLAGRSGNNFLLKRFNTNGSVDTAFGSSGVVTTPATTVDYNNLALGYQPSGIIANNPAKIVLVGGASSQAFVARYNLDGSLDTGFNSTGKLSFNLGNATNGCGVSFHTNQNGPDRIYVGGSYSQGFSITFHFFVTRLFLDGSFDTAWGQSGTASLQLLANAHVMDTSVGKIVVAGSTSSLVSGLNFALAKFNFSDGSIDTSFNGTGARTDDVGNEVQTAEAVALQADNKIVTTTLRLSKYGGVSRFNPDGSFDTSFQGTGQTFLTDQSELRAIAVQPDGKILAAGHEVSGSGAYSFLVVRYNTDGTLDTSFNGSGIVTTTVDPTSNVDYAYGLVLQPDNKIILAGASYSNSTTFYRFALVRYNSDGTLDTTFNGTGKVVTAVGSNSCLAAVVALQSDGKIVAGGSSYNGTNNDFALVRYNSNGTLDPSFNGTGKVTTSISVGSDTIYALGLDGNRIVAAGTADPGPATRFAFARYNSDGSLDTTLAATGKLVLTIGASDQLNSMRVQPDGRITAAGYTTTNSNPNLAIVRLNRDGSLDSSFATGGIKTIDFGDTTFDHAEAMTLDPLGRLLVVGDSNNVQAMARLLGDPLLRITSISRASATQINLLGLGVPGVPQNLQSSNTPDASGFTTFVTLTPDVNGLWSRTNLNVGTTTPLFFRFVLP